MASTPPAPDTLRPRLAGRAGLTFVWIASTAVLTASLLAAFRLPFASDGATLLLANGPRILFAAAVGAALALSGALQLLAGGERPWRELESLALSTGAAGGGFALVLGHAGSGALLRFAGGAVAGAFVFWVVARALDRPKRWTNLAVALALAGMTGTAALAGSYARARTDVIAPAVTWLLGDLRGATVRSGLLVLVLVAAVLVAGLLTPSRDRWRTLAWIAFGLGVGAAGPLAFVVLMVPLVVRSLIRAAPPGAFLPTSAAAGAATVVAVDTVPRLLVGGYDFPWNVPAALLAIPGFLTWNRMRLRRQAGRASLAFEILEIVILAGLTLGVAALAAHLTRVVRLAT